MLGNATFESALRERRYSELPATPAGGRGTSSGKILGQRRERRVSGGKENNGRFKRARIRQANRPPHADELHRPARRLASSSGNEQDGHAGLG